MNVLAWILGIILAAVFGLGGATKLIDLDRMREHFGYSATQYRLIGLTEVAGAGGVIAGLAWPKIEWLGGAAAIGLCCLMVGALMVHARVEDETKKIIPAMAMFVLSLVFLIVLALR